MSNATHRRSADGPHHYYPKYDVRDPEDKTDDGYDHSGDGQAFAALGGVGVVDLVDGHQGQDEADDGAEK